MAFKFILLCFASYYIIDFLRLICVKLSNSKKEAYVNYIEKGKRGEISQKDAVKLDAEQTKQSLKEAREHLHNLNESTKKISRFNEQLKYD